MDEGFVAAEDSHKRDEPPSRSLGSPGVPVKSLAIDLNCEMEEIQSPKHEHFSILGYVSEMRNKDRKVCLPFASEGGDDMDLPPLPVPKFRWWQCSGCVPNVLNNEGGNSFPRIPTEVNQVQMKEITHNNSGANNSSTRPHEPEKSSSPSGDEIAIRSFPPRRKRKLRSLVDIIKEDKNLLPTQPIEDDLEASLDAPKGDAKTPHRKRTMVLEEEEEMVPSIHIDKKLKGPVTESDSCTNDTNTTVNRVEVSDSELERDSSGPTLFGSRLSVTTNQNKARKQRSLDINRKARRDDTRNRTVRKMVNLQKYPPVAAGTNFCGAGSVFKNSLFGQQIDSIHDKSIGKKKVEEGHYNPYIPPSNKDGLGTLDLSLGSYTGGEMNLEKQESSGRHTGIPDLNESFVEKMSMTESIQLPEKTLHTNLGMFSTSNKKTDNNNAVVVERGGASSDIPMEIVELLAKNQYERALDNSKKHPGPDGFNNTNPFKASSPYIKGTPSMFNSRSCLSGTMGFLSLPPPKTRQSDNGQLRHSSSPLMPGQHRIGLCSGPNILSGPRPSNGANVLWPPRRKNVTFNLGLPSGPIDQTYKGKNVQMAVTDGSLVREGGFRLGCKPVGSVDTYSNEAIPAMQLLSLMDQRIVTVPSRKVGAPNNFLDRQSSLSINKNHYQNDQFIGSSSLLGQSSRTNDFPALLNGARSSGDYSSKKSFPQGRMPPLKGNYKAIDLAGPSNVSAEPSTSNLKMEACTLNRNPADFSIPDARNEFMISAKDLNPKKRNPSKEKSRPAGPKKQRARKNSSRR